MKLTSYRKTYRKPLRRRFRRRKFYKSKRVNSRIHTFKRKFLLTTLSLQQTPLEGNISISLSDLPNASEYTALFDQYKITGLQLDFQPSASSSDLNPGTTINNIGSMITAIDHNDLTNANSTVLMEYGTAKRTSLLKPFKRFIKTSTLSDEGEVKYNKWYSTNDDDVLNLGLKYATSGALSSGTMGIDIFSTVYLQCKQLI